MGPILIHLILPLTLVPTSGMNKAINKKILSNINTQSALNKKSDGRTKKKSKAIIPIATKKACLFAK